MSDLSSPECQPARPQAPPVRITRIPARLGGLASSLLMTGVKRHQELTLWRH